MVRSFVGRCDPPSESAVRPASEHRQSRPARAYAEAMLRLRVLGALTGEADGRPVAMPSSERARALIGWLAWHRGNHPRAAVAGRLWPDATEAGAPANP